MTTRSIETEAPGVLARADDAEHLAWLAARTRRLWRRRALPTLGIVGLLLLWWAVVVWFDVKPFIAPSPVVVLQTLYAKRDVLLANLLPTAIEAAGGFFLGNLAAILVATVVRAQQDAAGHLLPGRADVQRHPDRRQGADPGADHGQRHGAEDHHRRAGVLLSDPGQHGARARSR